MADKIAELRDKWSNLYPARLNEGNGDGSLIGAAYIIARSACSDIPALLDVVEAARKVLLGPCRHSHPTTACSKCDLRAALAALDGADRAR